MSLVCDKILSVDLLVRVRDVNVITKQVALNDVITISFAAVNERRFCKRTVRLQVLSFSNDNLSTEHSSFRIRLVFIAEFVTHI